MKFSFLVTLVIFAFTLHTQAVELYTLVSRGCQSDSGLIVDYDENNIKMILTNGKLKVLPKESTEFVVIHNTIDNPIPRIELNTQSIGLLRKVFVGNSNTPSFIGWPVKFVENLVVFYDISGNTQIVELESISRINDIAESEVASKLKMHAQKVELEFGDIGSQCEGMKAKSGLLPTKIFADKVQISELFSQFEQGFNKVRGYQERTHLYPRPLLFKQKPRLGFTLFSDPIENEATNGPAFYQWGSGEPYRFQNQSQIGFVPVELLPSVEAFGVARTDLKSHLFHATFIGNLFALPGGTEFYTNKAFPQNDEDRTKAKFNNRIYTSMNINYLALMGIDWENWSFSMGNYYPLYFIQVLDEFREVLSPNPSLLFRIMYTTHQWRFRTVFSKVDKSIKGSVSDSDLSIDIDQSVVGQIDQLALDAQFIRFGVDYTLNSEMTIGADFILNSASYSEVTSAAVRNTMDFDHYTLSAYAENQFSDYVNIKIIGSYFKFDRDYNFNGQGGNKGESDFRFGGTFEFIF